MKKAIMEKLLREMELAFMYYTEDNIILSKEAYQELDLLDTWIDFLGDALYNSNNEFTWDYVVNTYYRAKSIVETFKAIRV